MGGKQTKEEEATQEPVKVETGPPIEEKFKEFPCDLAPKDDEGFVQSFSIDQEEEYSAFFKRYGFVVVNDVLSKVQVDAVTSVSSIKISHLVDPGRDLDIFGDDTVWMGCKGSC